MSTKPADSVRRNPSRRLLIVAVILLLVIAAGGGLYLWRLDRQASHIEGLKPRGLSELESEAYEKAVHTLRSYLGGHPDDTEALKAYAAARERVFVRGGRHIRQSVDARRRVLEIDPGDQETRRRLMEQYLQIGFYTEALEQARRILSDSPDDPQALRVLPRAHAGRKDYAEAIEAAARYGEHNPGDVEILMLMAQALHDAGESERVILDRVAESGFLDAGRGVDLQKQIVTLLREWDWDRPEAMRQRLMGLADRHDKADSFMSVLGFAFQLTGDANRAREAYRLAAERMPETAQEVGRLATLMDRLGLFAESTDLLNRAERVIEDRAVERLYVRRLLERGDLDRLLERVDSIDPGDPRIETETLGVYGLALTTARRDADVAGFIDALKHRRSDRLAENWARLLAVLNDPDADADPLESATATALLHHPDHPYFNYFRGEALASQRQMEEAIDAWQTSAKLAPSWAKPMTRISEAFLQTERAPLALQAARAAVARSPRAPRANVALVNALTPQLHELSTAQAKELLDRIERLPETLEAAGLDLILPARAAIHARVGDTEAAAGLIEAALARPTPPAPPLLMQLAGVSEQYDLGLTDRLLEAHRESEGLTAAVARLKALRVARDEGAEAAVAVFDAALAQADRRDPLAERRWALVRADLIERLGHGHGLAEWRALIERYPDDAAVLRRAAESETVWPATAVARELLVRLRETVGEDSVLYRRGRARMLMAEADAGQRELAEATSLLLELTREYPYLLQPHLLLADAFVRLENPGRALEVLNQAQVLAPRTLSIAIQRVRLLQELGEQEQAGSLLARLREWSPARPEQRVQIAHLSAIQGDTAWAESELRSLLGDDPGFERARLSLASLLWQWDRADEAAEHIETLLPGADSSTLRLAIAFYESQGDDAAVRRLAQDLAARADASAAELASVRARLAFRAGGRDEAMSILAAAADAGDATPVIWRELVLLRLQDGDVDAALETAAAAAAAYPEDQRFKAFADHQALVRQAAREPRLQQLTAALLSPHAARETAIAALRLVISAEREQRAFSEVALEMRALADSQPALLPLQDLMMGVYRSMDRPSDAIDIAVRTMRVAPASAQAALTAARALAEASRWQEAQEALREYERRSGGHTLASDLLFAETHIELGRGEAAMAHLDRHLEDATEQTRRLLAETRARALIKQGRVTDARELLEPRLPESPESRQRFIRLALTELPEADLAERWLLALERSAPDATAEDRMRLAAAWHTASRRWPRSDFSSAALARFHQLVDDPDHGPQALEAIGVIHELDGRFDAAADAYREALDRDDSRLAAANNLAMIRLRRGRPTEALPLAADAAERSPDNPEFQDTYALALIANHRGEEAVEVARRATRLESTQASFHLTLGEALIEAGRPGEARAVLDRFDRVLETGQSLPEPLQDRLAAFRRALDEPTHDPPPPGASTSGAGAASELSSR